MYFTTNYICGKLTTPQVHQGLQMIRVKYDSCKLTGWFAQNDSRNRGWFAQFYGCFTQASCYVVFISN